MDVDKATRVVRGFALILSLSALVFTASWLGVRLTRFGSPVASLWLANALVVAFILRFGERLWPAAMASAFAANVAANLADGDRLADALFLSACNIIEITLVAVLLVRRFGAVPTIATTDFLGRFLVIAGVVGPGLTGLIAATYLAAGGAPWGASFLHWWLADAMGLLIVVPLLLSLPARPWSLPSLREAAEPAILLTLVGMSAALVFAQDFGVMFATIPALVLLAFRSSPGVAALGVFLVAFTAMVATALGSGPIYAAGLAPVATTLFLQAFVLAVLLVTLPLNIVITERNRLGSELIGTERLKRAEAEALSESKIQFLATMSHEIRTPLTGVLGMIDLLDGNPTREERELYLSTMRQSGDLLMSVLDDVLDFSKIECGKFTTAEAPFDFEAIGQSTVDLFFNAASRKGVLLTFTCDPGGSSIVNGDRVRLQQVMSNFLSNAIKFTDRGTVKATLRCHGPAGDGRRWRFEVRDSGPGVEPSQQEQMFEPFMRAPAALGGRHGGTGLGLAISKRLIEAMGGSIGVTSAPGKGSTFWFEIDLADADRDLVTARAPTVFPGIARPLQVLVAEDNNVNQLLIHAMLTKMGHRVTLCSDGLQAVAAAATETFDCILMDMQMPQMDGAAATRRIRGGRGPNAAVPILALTADASPERRRFYDNIGLTDFLTKPVDAALLAARLREIAADRDRPSAGAPLVTPSLFDPAQIASLRAALGPRRLSELIDAFSAELSSRTAMIRASLSGGDLERARRESHSLKGAAANLGATLVSKAAAGVEKAPDIAEAITALERLERSAAEAALAIRRHDIASLSRAV